MDKNGEGSTLLRSSTATDVAEGGAPSETDSRAAIARAVSDLALAVQRHRIYPSSSPLCLESVTACRGSLSVLPDGLELRVSPSGLDAAAPLPTTPMVRELGDRLFRADVEAVEVEVAASASELARFARLVARWDRRADPSQTIAERLLDEGVTAVRLRMTERLQVLEIPPLRPREERALREERGARGERRVVDPLEEGGGTWVRAEIGGRVESLDLVDLAALLDDPLELARVLLEARGDDPDGSDPPELLAASLTELVNLYGALGPASARTRFEALAGTIGRLDESARTRLADEVLLPDLLETGRVAALIAALPDAEIGRMLGRFAERRLGAPGLVEAALERLGLPRERETAVRSALRAVGHDPVGRNGDGTTARRELSDGLSLGGNGATAEALLELAAQDLAVDRATERSLRELRQQATGASDLEERLRSRVQLVYHVANPEVAAGFLDSTVQLLGSLVERGDLSDAARWVGRLRVAADAVRSHGPEVSEAVERSLAELCSVEFVRRAVRGWEEPEPEKGSRELLAALGPIAAPRLLEALEQEPSRAARRRLIDFMRQEARELAPGLLPCLSDPRWTVVRNAVSVLGFAGEGYESGLTLLLEHEEPRVVREAFLALARIGSEEAALRVVERVRAEDAAVREMACESVRRFPRATGRRMAGEVLADPTFPARWPAAARELVRHFFSRGRVGAERAALESLKGLRFHLWHPGRMRLGWAATAALRGADE